MDRKVVSIRDFRTGTNGPARLADELFGVIDRNAAYLQLLPVELLPDDDGSVHNGYDLDELVKLVDDNDRVEQLLRLEVSTTTGILLVKTIMGLKTRERTACVNEIGRRPPCFTCGNKMRPSGDQGMFVCEGCGSTHNPGNVPGVGAA